MTDMARITLQNLCETDLVDLATYFSIPQSNSIYTAFDGGLVNIQQLINTGATTMEKFVAYIVANIDPYPALCKSVLHRLNIMRELDGDQSSMDHGAIGPITNISFRALEEFNWHLGKLKSLIPFQVDESFIDKHISFPRVVGRG